MSIQPAVTAQWKHHSCGRAAGRGGASWTSAEPARGTVEVMRITARGKRPKAADVIEAPWLVNGGHGASFKR